MFILFGVGSVLLVSYLVVRMDRSDSSPVLTMTNPGIISYTGWLLWQVIISNWDVARRIWDPSMPIKPMSRKIPVRIKDPLIRSIYANSITLTPGTVTTEVGDDYFIVHALDQSGIEVLHEGEMESKLLQLEQNS